MEPLNHAGTDCTSTERTVVFVIYDGLQPLDLTGPHEVFATANRMLDHRSAASPRYRLVVAAEAAGSVRSESGLAVVASHAFADVSEAIDTLIIVGGDGALDLAATGETVSFLRASAPACRRVASVCTGAFPLAEAGLLDGRSATTHWYSTGLLARRFPRIDVDPDAIYVQQGRIWTSAGVTAGIDLALALVEQDCGPEIAQNVARSLVVPLRRSGNQTQHAAPVWGDPVDRGPIRDAHDLIHADPAADLAVAVIADRVGMSERNFARRFRQQIGESPARYVERVRVEVARGLLESSTLTVDHVASRAGLGSAETLRRAFHRRLGLSPEMYRRQHLVAAAERRG